ncbi:hypothetical protein EUX98_g3317 [Antrodiella citrinella]|uniref:NmrA-like domain-containing protein n=1 Tax=Antrodiella citrinella TaxID=2447956 RepID=A0A4V3XIX3_9APHY|nr:hypothetical protein EUX98_g3317 [Antrodiella citrinella]
MPKYVLTGATGGIGSRVFKHLLDLVPASEIVVSLYNPAGATPAITSSGVEVRRGDFSDSASLEAAYAGAEKLLIVSYPSIAYEVRVKAHKAAIDAAKVAGIKHIYYTSLAFASDSKAAVMQAHLDTEAYLKESGLTYTIIREGIYNESWQLYFGWWDPKEGSDEVVIPYTDGSIAWACRDDLGEGTAKIIVAESGYDNRQVLLSGSQSTTLSELATTLSELLSRKLTLKIVTLPEFIAHNTPKTPIELIESWSTTWTAIGRGELAVKDPLLKELLGREPVTVEETLNNLFSGKEDGVNALSYLA